MIKYSTSKTMMFTARQLYDLALDIKCYPEFVPTCKRVEVGEPEELGCGAITFDTVLEFRLRRLGIYEEFVSRVTADPEDLTIISESNGPPFKRFRAVWAFSDVGDGMAEASISVAYEFRSRVLGLVLDHGAGLGVRRVIRAWEERAGEIYGSV